jgi:hypothetical protein
LLLRLSPRSHFEDFAFIYNELTVVTNGDFKAIERTWRWPFEIQTGLKKPAAMARAFKFVLGGKPTGRAAQVSAFGEDGVDAGFFPNDPDPLFLLVLFADFTHCVIRRQACFEG